MDAPAGTTARIPLFPLHTVLFPGNPLPVRVFEPRYQRMLHDLGDDLRFGVVLIREGAEVGGPAVPHRVGTLAQVEERSDQGTMTHLVARGTRRFEVRRTFHEKPYAEAEVAWLDDPPAAAPGHAHGDEETMGHGHKHLPIELEVAALFEEYLQLLAEVTRVPLDPEVAAVLRGERRAGPWAMACAVAGTLFVPPEEKQPVLEAASIHDALHVEQELLARETARLRVLARRSSAGLN